MRAVLLATALLLPAGCSSATVQDEGGTRGDPRSVRIPGSSIEIAMVRVPPLGDHSGFWMSATEISWEAYDAFVFRLDEKDPSLPANADAVARPSQPYITMDRAFGHAGYPVISVSFLGAKSFCEWLASRTGRPFRLPTEEEWEMAARSTSTDSAWTRETSGKKTHPVGSSAANSAGFHDLLGNAAEWCVAPDGTGVLRGGSYLDSSADDLLSLRVPPDKAWNKSDPQIPKSKWWLADGGFIGFRIVCEE